MAKEIQEDGAGAMVAGTPSAVPVNSMGSSSSTAGTGGIDTFDPLLQKNKKKLRSIIKRRPLILGKK